MPLARLSPWSDWLPIPLAGCIWHGPNTTTFGTFNDIGDAVVDMLDPLVDADFRDGAIPKIQFARETAGDTYGYFFQIPVPDYVCAKQNGRFSDWTGLVDEAMAVDGGRRVGLQIRNIIASRNATGVGSDITRFQASVKFRGYGGDDGTTADLHVAAHQDAPVTGDTIATSSGTVSAFGDMEIPGNPAADSLNPDVPTFAPDGVCRIDTLVEVPITVSMGDVAEIISRVVLPVAGAGVAGIPVQWYGAFWRWILPPFPFLPNRSIQLLGQTADDDDADNRAQLEAQSRDDDLPYQP